MQSYLNSVLGQSVTVTGNAAGQFTVTWTEVGLHDLLTVESIDLQVPATSSISTTHAGTIGTLYHIVYDSYGNILSVVDAANIAITDTANLTTVAYAGYRYDVATETYVTIHRIYDPKTGTWSIPDPIRLLAGQSNFYVYCGNDPINGTDPTGLTELLDFTPSNPAPKPYPGMSADIAAERTYQRAVPDHQQIEMGWKTIMLNITNLKGSGITQAEINAQVAEANEIWKPAAIRFVVSTISTLNEAQTVQFLQGKGRPDAYDNSGIWQINSRRANVDYSVAKQGASMQIIYANYLSPNATAAGVSMLFDSGGKVVPSTLVALNGRKSSGHVLAHEIGHLLLSQDHDLFPFNLMAGGDWNLGDRISADQIKTARASVFGTTAPGFTPAFTKRLRDHWSPVPIK